MMHLLEMPVLAIDCQTTGASPKHGHLLELAWCRTRAAEESEPEVASFLLELPDGESIPRRIQRMTGIGGDDLDDAISAHSAWRRLSEEAQLAHHGIIHYARFEKAFLDDLEARVEPDGPLSLDIMCTHDICRRLFPDLPRRGIRAVAGYLGHPLEEKKRAADHALATAAIWRHIVARLTSDFDVTTLDALYDWLGRTKAVHAGGKGYAIERKKRLSLRRAPGVYRMLGKTGNVLYVGKATCLRGRVNTYFQTRRGLSEDKLELVTQVWDVEVSHTPTPLEAALLECDEIKRHSPPYNHALRENERTLAFASRDWSDFAESPSPDHPVGPLRSTRSLQLASALIAPAPAATWLASEAPAYLAGAAEHLEDGLEVFSARHASQDPLALEQLALELWREHRLDDDEEPVSDGEQNPEAEDADAHAADELQEWSPERVADMLESSLRRAHYCCRRARWLCRLTQAAIGWRPQIDRASGRQIIIEAGQITEACDWTGDALSTPSEHALSPLERQRCFDLATWDRLRVLTTELRRLVGAGCEVRVRFGPRDELGPSELASLLALI